MWKISWFSFIVAAGEAGELRLEGFPYVSDSNPASSGNTASVLLQTKSQRSSKTRSRHNFYVFKM